MPLAVHAGSAAAACADNARRATAALPHWASAPRRRSAGAVPGSPRAVGGRHGRVPVALFLLMLTDRRRQLEGAPTSSTRAHSLRAPLHTPLARALPCTISGAAQSTPSLQLTAPRPMILQVWSLVKAHRGLGAQHPRRAQRHLAACHATPRRAAPRRVAPHRTASRSIATHQSRTKGTAVVVVMCVPYVEEGPGPSHVKSPLVKSPLICSCVSNISCESVGNIRDGDL